MNLVLLFFTQRHREDEEIRKDQEMVSGGKASGIARAGLVAALGLALSACAPGPTGNAVRNGVAAAPPPGEAVMLDGDWSFTPASGVGPVPLAVPGVWNGLQPGRSSGSYGLTFTGLVPGRLYALQFKGVSSRARISADGRPIGAWGQDRPELVPLTYWFEPEGAECALTVDVENTTYSTGGLWLSALFGEASAVERASARDRIRDLLVIGAILMMALYHLTLYALRRDERSTLFFGLCCAAAALKTGLSDEQTLAMILPPLNGLLGLRLAYIATTLVPVTFLGYYHCVFKGHRLKAAMPVIAALGAAAAAVSALAPMRVVQSSFLAYQAASLLLGAYVLAALGLEIRDKSPGARTMLLGVVILLTAAVNDVLYDLKVIATFYSLGFGVFLFLFTQSVMLSRIFSRSFKEAKDLAANLERRVAERTRELEELSRVDALTGLTNRRHFWALLEMEWARRIRYGQDFCVVMIDLDRFKDLNDSLGHAAGDEALRNLGLLLRSSVRGTDTVARYGGEEFCLILPGTGIPEALRLMEKIRVAVASSPLIERPEPTVKTLSYGIAKASAHASAAELLDAADKLMYRAKETGRNRGCAEEE